MERTEKIPRCLGRAPGKIWVENPHVPHGFLWPKWFGAQNYQIIRRTPPQTTKILATVPLGIFRVFRGTKIPQIDWEAAATQATRAKCNHRETGGFSALIFPGALHGVFETTKNSPFFVPQGLWGELWEKIWVENPHFPYGFLWPGWSGAQIPEIYWEDPRTPPKNFATLPLAIFKVFRQNQTSQFIGKRRPPKPPRPKVTIGQLGGFQPSFSPHLSPRNFGKTMARNNLPVVSFGLGGRGPGQRKTIGKMGALQPRFPQRSLQVILEKK